MRLFGYICTLYDVVYIRKGFTIAARRSSVMNAKLSVASAAGAERGSVMNAKLSVASAAGAEISRDRVTKDHSPNPLPTDEKHPVRF